MVKIRTLIKSPKADSCLSLDVMSQYSAGIVTDANDEFGGEVRRSLSNQSYPMLAAPEYESSKPYEWGTSGAGFAAASEDKSKGSHFQTVVQEQQTSESSLRGGYGVTEAVDWKESRRHAPAISKARLKHILQSSLDSLDDLRRVTQVKFQSLLDFLQDSWFLEIGACVTALVLFIAEIVILRVFEKIDLHPIVY